MFRFRRPKSRFSRLSRVLRVESLDDRYMLSAPTVTDVSVASTQWAPAFVSYLQSSGQGAGGYSIPVGSSNQLQTLPWRDIDQVRITFDQNVVVNESDLCVSGTNQPAYPVNGFQYDSAAHVAVWTLANNLAKDKLMLDLDANGLAPVRSAADGSALDGAWTDGQSVYPSGNGAGGQDFKFSFNVLPGDTNADNGVNLSDALLARAQIGKSAGAAGYNARYDIDGGGVITTDEYNAIRSLTGGTLPAGLPAAAYASAPTTAGVPNASVNENVPSQFIDLTSYFQDDQTSSGALTYAIVGDSNASLFNSLVFDGSGGLTLNFPSGTHGDAQLTVRATDSGYGGLFVETTFNVHVNAAPVISFGMTYVAGDEWTISGSVSDPDGSVDGLAVNFGGVLAAYNLSATVQSDGTFSITSQLTGLQAGIANAQTQDSFGAPSNLAEFYVVTG